MPSFNPIEYDPSKLIKTVTPTQSIQQPEYRPVIPKKKEKEKSIEIPPCPGKTEQRVGDFRNDKRLERVIGHERSEDGSKCITLYEDVTFIEQYIPGPAQLISTAAIATVAATTPLLLNIVKPLVKNLIKKLTKKKNKV